MAWRWTEGRPGQKEEAPLVLGKSREQGNILLLILLMVSGRISVLYWSCGGACNKSFLRNIREMIGLYKPEIIAFLEPRY